MKKKILLIDDDKGIVEVIRRALEESQFDVIPAYDGKEGLMQVKLERPDLIILDISMPSMNGYEFMRALRTNNIVEGDSMPPVVMLTAKQEMEEIFRMEGAKEYLVKPVDPLNVVEKVKSLLESNA